MNADEVVGALLVGAAALALLWWLLWTGLEAYGKHLLAKDEQAAKSSHDRCDVCRFADPHGLTLVRENSTGRLRLVCRGCSTEGAALGAYIVLERRRGDRS